MIEFFIVIITSLSIVYFLTMHFLETGLKKLKTPPKNILSDSLIKVSVIVACRNEEENIPGLIKCLLAQQTKNIDIEFILVNDRSEDSSGQLIDDRTNKDNRFKSIHIKDRVAGFAPKKYAIDCAIKEASGEINILTDADGRPGKDWVQSLVAYFQNGADMLLGYAPYTISQKSSLFMKMLALEYFAPAAVAAATTGLGYPLTCVGTNMAYRKNVYLEIGGFGEFKSFISGDDDLFLTRVRENGNYKIQYANDEKCHVFNAPPKTFKQFVNQRLRYASKGFVYPNKVTAGLTIYVLFNFFLFFGLIYGLFNMGPILWSSLAALAIKTFSEYKFTRKAAQAINDKRFTNYYFVTALLHVPYILFFGILGQLKIFRWAEKKTEHGIVK
ncbi:MAG: glycosyltransferase [Calditrichaeota bacterium]|nr:MAG: glycosyltransferase [Calditrichota bacterium]MBL1207861.1 glycosyltransferase [Calditrichota bacterium]NOG47695.1 glycosyltransferase [Calditrichota bacterium]